MGSTCSQSTEYGRQFTLGCMYSYLTYSTRSCSQQTRRKEKKRLEHLHHVLLFYCRAVPISRMESQNGRGAAISHSHFSQGLRRRMWDQHTFVSLLWDAQQALAREKHQLGNSSYLVHSEHDEPVKL